jgi:hypothetical protein
MGRIGEGEMEKWRDFRDGVLIFFLVPARID